MSSSWEVVLDDLEAELAVVLAAATGDGVALSSLNEALQHWAPPTEISALPDHLRPRAESLSTQHERAQRLLADRLRALRPQRAVARRIDTAVRTPAYLDVKA